MTKVKNSPRPYLVNGCTCLLITLLFTITAYSQQDIQSTMSDVRPDSAIESIIEQLFNESIVAGEQLDFNRMWMQVNDKYSAGFINGGKYYKSLDSLFADYKEATNGIKSQRLTIENKKITILSGNSALLTAKGQFSALTDNDNIINGKFVWTIVYKEIESEWKIIHTHMTNER